MNPLRVSFVIPSFNQGAFIERTIRSCIDQRLPDFEVIVQDGGSTDDTVNILKSFGDSISYRSEPDRGQGDAVNKAIDSATGTIIAWINSDDYYIDDEVLRAVSHEFELSPDVDFVFGNSVFVTTNGKRIRDYVPTARAAQRRYVLRHAVSPFPQPSVFFRKQLFLDAGRINPDLHLTLDLELWLRMLPLVRKWRYINRTLTEATLHPSAKSVHSVWDQVCEMRRVKLSYLDRSDGLETRLSIETSFLKNAVYGLGRKLLTSCAAE